MRETTSLHIDITTDPDDADDPVDILVRGEGHDGTKKETALVGGTRNNRMARILIETLLEVLKSEDRKRDDKEVAKLVKRVFGDSATAERVNLDGVDGVLIDINVSDLLGHLLGHDGDTPTPDFSE